MIDIIFETCGEPSDLLRNAFFLKVFPAYLRRRGRLFLGHLVREALTEVIQCENFGVQMKVIERTSF
jgi:hypothetical protein